jgi:hypothetical protein
VVQCDVSVGLRAERSADLLELVLDCQCESILAFLTLQVPRQSATSLSLCIQRLYIYTAAGVVWRHGWRGNFRLLRRH